MKKGFFILLIFLYAISSGFAQLKTYSFEEVEIKIKENPKPIFVFIHTSWCKYCQMMKNSTFKNVDVIAILNKDFYFVCFDAENKDNISFNNHTFKFKPSGQDIGVHELAVELATIEGKVVYPTITILDPDYSILLQTSSYKDGKTLLSLLKSVLLRP
jgi:thioredoxin-related protein